MDGNVAIFYILMLYIWNPKAVVQINAVVEKNFRLKKTNKINRFDSLNWCCFYQNFKSSQSIKLWKQNSVIN